MRAQIAVETVLVIGALLLLLTLALNLVFTIQGRLEPVWQGKSALINLLQLKRAAEDVCPHEGFVRLTLKVPPQCQAEVDGKFAKAVCPHGVVIVPLDVPLAPVKIEAASVKIEGGRPCTVS